MSTDSIISTAIFFGLVSLAIYFFLLRPFLSGGQPPPREATRAARPRAPAPRTQASSSRLPTKSKSVPPHVSEKAAKMAATGGTNLLSDGVVAFRHTKAAGVEASLSAEQQAATRKDRALILAKLLEDPGLSTPPTKGSTLVVSVAEKEVNCARLRRVLFAMATYYNLMVIIVVNKDYQLDAVVKKLRGDQLTEEALPSHRIVAATTVEGRVAFVRQLPRIELVIDFDPLVKTTLERFGHKVIIVSSSESGSRLGNHLLA